MHIRIRKSYRTLDRSSPVVLYVEHYTSRIEFLNFVLPIYQISNVIWVVPNGHWTRHIGEIRRLNPSKQTKSLRSPAHSYKIFWLPMVIYIYINIFWSYLVLSAETSKISVPTHIKRCFFSSSSCFWGYSNNFSFNLAYAFFNLHYCQETIVRHTFHSRH